jgi:hypothetical protein
MRVASSMRCCTTVTDRSGAGWGSGALSQLDSTPARQHPMSASFTVPGSADHDARTRRWLTWITTPSDDARR